MKNITKNKRRLAVNMAVCLALQAGAGFALAQAGPGGEFVSKEDYNQLLKRYEQLEKQMRSVLDKLDKPQTGQPTTPPPAPSGGVSQAAFDDLRKQVEDSKVASQVTLPGTTKFNLGGYGAVGFAYQQHGGDRLFSAQFNPLFLWKLSDRLFFEGELELELQDGDTHAALEQAHLAYLVNDYMTLDAGKFLNPMNSFVERFHMAWVNHLPDHPLAVYDGLLPETFVGAQVRGTVPIGPTKLNYAAFVANAPSLNTQPDADHFADLGTLTFDNFNNVDGQFISGGHVGFLPIPEVEIGYGVMAGNVAPSGQSAAAWIHSVDLNVVKDSQALRGLVRLNTQWVWSRVGSYPYDATLYGGPSPFSFDNNRNGGYAQLSYRPTKWGSACLSRLEPVFRFDLLDQKNTPTGFDERRYTVGLNYWLGPMTVLKAAYQFDHRDGDIAHDALLLQFATGF